MSRRGMGKQGDYQMPGHGKGQSAQGDGNTGHYKRCPTEPKPSTATRRTTRRGK